MMADRIQIDVQESLGTITLTTRYPDMLIREIQRRGAIATCRSPWTTTCWSRSVCQ